MAFSRQNRTLIRFAYAGRVTCWCPSCGSAPTKCACRHFFCWARVLRTASFKRKSLIASPFAPCTLPFLRSFDVPATASLKIPAALTNVV